MQLYLNHVWSMTAEMAPYLIAGFAIAGLLHRILTREWVEKVLGKRGLASIANAALVGVPMPLCSCGVIPVTAGLRHRGASKGASVSFLTSTPQTGIDSIAATYGMMGPIFAIYRVAVAFISGIAIGLLVDKTCDNRATIEKKSVSNTSTHRPTLAQALRYGLAQLPGEIANSLVFGILIAGLISALAPQDMLGQLPGGTWTAIILTTIIATPFYICSTGSIPLAVALVHAGLPLSAALVFLIAGPATNTATILTMRKILGAKETIVYLVGITICSWIAAFGFEAMFPDSVIATEHAHEMPDRGLFGTISGIALILLLAWGKFGPSANSEMEATEDTENLKETLTIRIAGMSCNHCRQSVQSGLADIDRANPVAVDLKSGEATIRGNELDHDAYTAKVGALGYEVTGSDVAKS